MGTPDKDTKIKQNSINFVLPSARDKGMILDSLNKNNDKHENNQF